jgi:hypothetical protein
MFPEEFSADLAVKKCFLGNFLRILLQNYLRIVRRRVFCGFGLIFGRKFRRKISCGFKISQETITYEGFSWEPESAGNSIGNTFPANLISSSVRSCARRITSVYKKQHFHYGDEF